MSSTEQETRQIASDFLYTDTLTFFNEAASLTTEDLQKRSSDSDITGKVLDWPSLGPPALVMVAYKAELIDLLLQLQPGQGQVSSEFVRKVQVAIATSLGAEGSTSAVNDVFTDQSYGLIEALLQGSAAVQQTSANVPRHSDDTDMDSLEEPAAETSSQSVQPGQSGSQDQKVCGDAAGGDTGIVSQTQIDDIFGKMALD